MDMTHGLIAIIDEDEMERYIYKKIVLLTCPSYRVIDFTNGLEALSYLRKHAAEASRIPDIILFDVKMPVLNGCQYLDEYSKIKSRMAKQPRHYAYTLSMQKYSRQIKNESLQGFYMKPVSPQNILNIVRESEVFSGRRQSLNGSN
jgi:CheY-like chemotaxis protein